jgi:hypothetical protein
MLYQLLNSIHPDVSCYEDMKLAYVDLELVFHADRRNQYCNNGKVTLIFSDPAMVKYWSVGKLWFKL